MNVYRARAMRHAPTASEAALWHLLQGNRLGVAFRRQVPIGTYIVDFCAPSVKLVVEVDNGYYASTTRADARRGRRLTAMGYRVLRVADEEARRSVEVAVERIRAAMAG